MSIAHSKPACCPHEPGTKKCLSATWYVVEMDKDGCTEHTLDITPCQYCEWWNAFCDEAEVDISLNGSTTGSEWVTPEAL